MTVPAFENGINEDDLQRIRTSAREATDFLKALSHEGRLLILCHLASGEKSVTELERLLSQRQASVSQQLARLRLEGLVEPRRDGKAIYYSLSNDRVKPVIELLYGMFCANGVDTDHSETLSVERR